MEVTSKIPVNLFAFDNESLIVKRHISYFDRNVDLTLSFKFHINKEETGEAINIEFLDDDKALMGQTEVKVRYDLTQEEEERVQLSMDSDRPQLHHELFLYVVNDFIITYRYKTQKWWVEKIFSKHLRDINLKFQFSPLQTGGGYIGFAASDPKKRDKIRQDVSDAFGNNQKIPIFLEYFLLAKKYVEYERFDLASVFINISLESLVYLLSLNVLGQEEHKILTESSECQCCKKPVYLNMKGFLAKVDESLGYDHAITKKLIDTIQRPNGSQLRNNIAHGKIVFLENESSHKEDTLLQFQSFMKFTKIYSKQIQSYL